MRPGAELRTVHKVCACLVRQRHGRRELLVFDHPLAGTQIPKGTVDPGESNEAAVLRELHEETGVSQAVITQSLGVWVRLPDDDPDWRSGEERHEWEVFLLEPASELPDTWSHQAEGSEEERRHLFGCRWVPLDETTAGALHELFGPVVAMLLRD